MPHLHFTPHEVEALRHRLDAADCIADAFANTPKLARHDRDTVEQRANELACLIDHRWPLQVDRADTLTREILREAIEGSTWNAVHDSADVSPQRRAAAARALRSAADKITLAFRLGALTIPEA